MNIPNNPDIPVIIKREDGNYYWTEEWQNIWDQLFQTLQLNASEEGLVPPSQSTANIAIIEPTSKEGTIIYDSTTKQFKGNEGGVFKIFTLT